MSARPNFDREEGLAMLALMERIRAFEARAILAAERDRTVLGAIHPSIGQEAVAAGVVGAMRRDDALLSTHRGHGHTLAKGADSGAMMKELLGRAGGCCGGKGGSMHIADFSVGMLGANGVVAANIPIAAGAAHAIRLMAKQGGGDRVAVCLFGDGAANRGPFLEGLNWAGVFRLPILFVCEDNRYAATTRTAEMTAGPGPMARAEALGLRATRTDGNDAVETRAAAREILARLRAGGGPEFLHAVTWRRTGHTSFDKALYRDVEETEREAENDPLARLRAALAAAGVGAAALDALRAQAEAEMARAYDLAAAAPFPDPATAFDDVQDVGSPAREPA